MAVGRGGEDADAGAVGDGRAERKRLPAVARAERARGEDRGAGGVFAQVERAGRVRVGVERLAVVDEQVELVSGRELAREDGELRESLLGAERAAEGVLARADAVEQEQQQPLGVRPALL